jgi:hypothetical protein
LFIITTIQDILPHWDANLSKEFGFNANRILIIWSGCEADAGIGCNEFDEFLWLFKDKAVSFIN